MTYPDCTPEAGLTMRQAAVKRAFDFALALLGLVLTGWILLISFVIACIDTRKCGFFLQTRIGRWGRPFNLIKLRTMCDAEGADTTVTSSNDRRITTWGRFFRKTKVDELPQLINVLLGDMSFVGPRPDVPGFADRLEGDDRIVLSVRPGITGPATLKYQNEEALLARQVDPEEYNRTVIYPHKVRINKEYIRSYHFWIDLKYILATIFSSD